LKLKSLVPGDGLALALSAAGLLLFAGLLADAVTRAAD
jgi:hypothetical protein